MLKNQPIYKDPYSPAKSPWRNLVKPFTAGACVLLAFALLAFHTDPASHMAACALILIALCWIGMCAYRYYREREYLRIDPLTGYHNRRWLEEVMPGKHRSRFEKQFQDDQLFILTIGITRIRSILETVGRQAIADKLKEILEEVMKDTVWAKLGVTSTAVGQIFVVCCFKDKSEIFKEISKILHRHDHIEIAYGTVQPKLKAGIAPMDSSLSFKEAVSEAMIKATAAYNTAFSGSETISVYEGNYSRQSVLQSKIEAVVEKALEKKEFLVFYQPKYELGTGKTVGAESLVRWQSEELGFLNPGSFIDLFEKNGFIVQLDYYVLEKVMMYQRRRLDLGLPIVPISVNQSRHHLTEPDYLSRMKELAQKYQLTDGAVELELTEAVFGSFDQLKYQNSVINDFRKLRELGFLFSIDGFGSGYSSFRLLSQLPFHFIKIDKSLLRSAETSRQMQVVISGIVDMGEKLDMAVLCEGIETVSQEQLLIKLGCKYGQGFLNGRPMPEKEFDELLEKKLMGGKR